MKKGEFVCILGDVGSGKSSILSALTGDLLYMEKDFYQVFKNIEVQQKLAEKISSLSQERLKPERAPIVFNTSGKYGKIAFAP